MRPSRQGRARSDAGRCLASVDDIGRLHTASGGRQRHRQGRFTQWLLTELKTVHPGFSPADPRKWADTGWSADRHFAQC